MESNDPGGRFFSVYTQTYQLGADAKEIVWSPDAITWLQAIPGDYVPAIVFHARQYQNPPPPTPTCTGVGHWAINNSGFGDPPEDWPSTTFPGNAQPFTSYDRGTNCGNSPTELRVFPASTGSLQSVDNGGKYQVRGVWYATGSSYHDYIDVSNYHMSISTQITDYKDPMTKFCYDKSGVNFTYVGRCEHRQAPLPL